MGADWAPYRDGHWAWIDPWGWTWVDDAPWGFAVSHYGRWANFRGTCGWVPGPTRSRASTRRRSSPSSRATSRSRSPAATWAASAWFPLGPREVYRPLLSREPRLFREREPQQHGDQQHRDQQLLQPHERDEDRLRQPAGGRRRRRRARDGLRPVATRVPFGRARHARDDGRRDRSPPWPPSPRPRGACGATPARAASSRPASTSGPSSRAPRRPRRRWASPRSSACSPTSRASRSTKRRGAR